MPYGRLVVDRDNSVSHCPDKDMPIFCRDLVGWTVAPQRRHELPPVTEADFTRLLEYLVTPSGFQAALVVEAISELDAAGRLDQAQRERGMREMVSVMLMTEAYAGLWDAGSYALVRRDAATSVGRLFEASFARIGEGGGAEEDFSGLCNAAGVALSRLAMER
jgi:hypothetical protein